MDYKEILTYWLNVFCSEIKERIKKTKDEKKAKKAEVVAKTQKSQGKGSNPKGAAPKGPKLGGGGGKRWATFLFVFSFHGVTVSRIFHFWMLCKNWLILLQSSFPVFLSYAWHLVVEDVSVFSQFWRLTVFTKNWTLLIAVLFFLGGGRILLPCEFAIVAVMSLMTSEYLHIIHGGWVEVNVWNLALAFAQKLPLGASVLFLNLYELFEI